MRSNVGVVASSRFKFLPNMLSGLQFWFDGADSASMSLSGSAVQIWYDKSGVGRHVYPAVSSPYVVPFGHYNAVSFSGVNQHLITSMTHVFQQPITIFTVAANNSPLSTGGGRVVSSRSATLFQAIHSEGSAYRTGVIYAGNWCGGPGDAIIDTGRHLVTSRFNGNGSKVWVDGVEGLAAQNDAGTNPLDFGVLGARNDGTFPLNGFIAEVLMYNYVLDDTNRIQVENYLRGKWGTP